MAAPGHRSGVRGRPPRPTRSTLHRPGWFECDDRIAWLLRANRLYGPYHVTIAAFAAAFHGGSFHHEVSVSQISKWETAAARVKLAVLHRYEELLGLEPHHLVAVADWMYRHTTGSIGPPLLSRGIDPETPGVYQRIDSLLERALSADVMSGPDWDELTAYLTALPAVHLHPRRAWTELTERLLAELLIADGRAWLLRTEALKRLMADPRARAPIIAACGAAAADPTHQVVIEPLAILDVTRDPDANRHVLTQLRDPTSDRTLRGALLACLQKVNRHHFPPTDLRLLTATAADLLAIDDTHADARQLAASLLRRVFADSGPTSVRLRPGIDPAVQAVLAYGQTAPPATVDHVVDRLSAAVIAALPEDRPVRIDPMLVRLLGDLLFSPNSDDRLSAGQLIAATPLREPVASALATELNTAVAARIPELAVPILAAMPFIGRPVDRAAIERYIITSDSTPTVTAAAWAIGHVPGHSDRRFWHTALQTRLRPRHRPNNPANLPVLRGLVYGLGINREHTILHALRADPEIPHPIRTAAAWWLNIPTRISQSALR